MNHEADSLGSVFPTLLNSSICPHSDMESEFRTGYERIRGLYVQSEGLYGSTKSNSTSCRCSTLCRSVMDITKSDRGNLSRIRQRSRRKRVRVIKSSPFRFASTCKSVKCWRDEVTDKLDRILTILEEREP